MELGLDFDDSDFSQEGKEKTVLKSYNAKLCQEQVWVKTTQLNSQL